LGEGVADGDVHHCRQQRRLADERMRVSMVAAQLDVEDVALWHDQLSIAEQLVDYGVASQPKKKLNRRRRPSVPNFSGS
jgi:hypothetical protein